MLHRGCSVVRSQGGSDARALSPADTSAFFRLSGVDGQCERRAGPVVIADIYRRVQGEVVTPAEISDCSDISRLEERKYEYHNHRTSYSRNDLYDYLLATV